MGWNWRKSIKIGPARINLSKSGVGYSVGVHGFRAGRNAKGQKYTQTSIPGTGIYRRDYHDSPGKHYMDSPRHSRCDPLDAIYRFRCPITKHFSAISAFQATLLLAARSRSSWM